MKKIALQLILLHFIGLNIRTYAQIEFSKQTYLENLATLTKDVELAEEYLELVPASDFLDIDIGYKELNLAYYTGLPNDFKKSLQHFTAILEEHPTNIQALLGHGLATCRDINYARPRAHFHAIQDFLYVLQEDSTNLEALCYLAFAYMKHNHPSRFYYANFYLDLAQLHHPNNTTIYYFRGILDFVQQDYREAISNWEKVDEYSLKLFPRIGLTAYSKYKLGGWEKAWADLYRSSSEYESYSLIDYWELGRKAEEKENEEKASQCVVAE